MGADKQKTKILLTGTGSLDPSGQKDFLCTYMLRLLEDGCTDLKKYLLYVFSILMTPK